MDQPMCLEIINLSSIMRLYQNRPLKKKHVAICYHRVREACASGILRLAKEDTKTNLADLLTKNLDRKRHKYLVELILRHSQVMMNYGQIHLRRLMTSCNDKIMLEGGSWVGIFFMNMCRLDAIQRLARHLNYSQYCNWKSRRANTPNWLGQPLGENLRGLIERRGNGGNRDGPCRALVKLYLQ